MLDRLVRRDAAPAAWKTTALAWSVAVAAVSVPAAYAQTSTSSPSRTPTVNAAASAVPSTGASSPSDTLAMPDHYAVQKGQSLLDVASDLTHSTDKSVKQTLANAMFAANPSAFYGNNPSRLKVGAVLVVPRPGESPASAAAAASSSTASSTGNATANAPAASAASTTVTPTTAMTSAASSTLAVSVTLPATTNVAASAPATTAAAPASAASATLTVESASAVQSATAASVATVASGTAEQSAASAATAASNAQAWAGSIRPAPVAPVEASAATADSASLALASTQSVSSLQQLLQLKNRVLAAMQVHGFGSPASAPLMASAPRVASGTFAASGAHVAPAGDPVARPQGGLRGPLAVPAAFAVLIVVALGIWVCLPARRRKPQRDTDAPDGAPDRRDAASSSEAAAAVPPEETPLEGARGSLASSSSSAPAARTVNTAKSRLTAEPEEPESYGKLPPDDDPIFDMSSQNTPFGQPPFSFEEGAAGGLPTHDPQRSPFAETRTPFDTGLLLGLLEMHAHRHEVERFQETAHELWELTDGEGPDWKRASALGRRIDPDNPLYADDPFAAYRHQHETSDPAFVKPLPDVDLALPATRDGSSTADTTGAANARNDADAGSIHDATRNATPNATPGANSNADNAPSEPDASYVAKPLSGGDMSPPSHGDLDWLDAPSAASHEAFQPHPGTNASPQDDDVTLPEARRPEHVPVADPRDAFELGEPDEDARSVADEIGRGVAGAGAVAGLGASSDSLFSGDAVRASALRDAQVQAQAHAQAHARSASAPQAGAPVPAHAPIGAAGFGALKLDFDLELSPNAAAPGSTPTSHDLATIARNKLDLAIEYVELGDRAGARTLLNEVLATHDTATSERAQALLDTLK